MANLIAVPGWVLPHALANYLRDVLPGRFTVVVEPILRGVHIGAVIVGPQGLAILHDTGDPSQPALLTAAELSGDPPLFWKETTPADYPYARSAQDALRAFLADEFPDFRPPIRHFLVGTDSLTGDVADPENGTSVATAMPIERLPEAITGQEWDGGAGPIDEEQRDAIAVALHERRLTVSQRAARPFIFRSTSLLGRRHEVWTIRELIDYLDRNPEEGIHHLRDGTLQRWLQAQGADHLAKLAREVTRGQESDLRIPLERFLVESELVKRPRLSIQPEALDLGYLLPGQTRRCHLRVSKARGRGYLFGRVCAAAPWVQVEPATFQNGVLNAVVTVRSEGLLIDPEPYRSTIYLDTSASEEPLAVPVSFRLVGIPAPLTIYLLRPLLGAVTVGLVGSIIGTALGLATGIAPLGLAVALGWFLLGGIAAYKLPPEQPVRQFVACLLGGLFVWESALMLLGGLLLWIGYDRALLPGLFLMMALAIIPVVRNAIVHNQPPAIWPKQSSRMLLITVLLAGLLAATPLLVGGWQSWEESASPARPVERWVIGGSDWLEGRLYQIVDDLYLRYHDRH